MLNKATIFMTTITTFPMITFNHMHKKGIVHPIYHAYKCNGYTYHIENKLHTARK